MASEPGRVSLPKTRRGAFGRIGPVVRENRIKSRVHQRIDPYLLPCSEKRFVVEQQVEAHRRFLVKGSTLRRRMSVFIHFFEALAAENGQNL